MNLKVKAKLDPQFEPLSIVVREMREATKENGQDIIIAAERNDGYTTTYKTRIFPEGTGHDEENFRFVERIAKSLVWVAGAWKPHTFQRPAIPLEMFCETEDPFILFPSLPLTLYSAF